MAGEYYRECPQLSIKFEFAVALVLDSGSDSLLVVGLIRYGCTNQIAVAKGFVIRKTSKECEVKGILNANVKIGGTHNKFVLLLE